MTLFLSHLKSSPVSLLPLWSSLYPPHCDETVQEVGADDIGDERCVPLLVNQGDNIIPNMPLSLQLKNRKKERKREREKERKKENQ